MDYITTQEAARRLGLTREAVRRKARDGRLPSIRIENGSARGNLYAIPAIAVENELLRRAARTA